MQKKNRRNLHWWEYVIFAVLLAFAVSSFFQGIKMTRIQAGKQTYTQEMDATVIQKEYYKVVYFREKEFVAPSFRMKLEDGTEIQATVAYYDKGMIRIKLDKVNPYASNILEGDQIPVTLIWSEYQGEITDSDYYVFVKP